jgi:hypothetical protein
MERSIIINSRVVSKSWKPRFYHNKVLVYNYPAVNGVFVKNIGAKQNASEKEAVAGFRVKEWNNKPKTNVPSQHIDNKADKPWF